MPPLEGFEAGLEVLVSGLQVLGGSDEDDWAEDLEEDQPDPVRNPLPVSGKVIIQSMS